MVRVVCPKIDVAPVTERDVAVVLPVVEVPEMSVEKVPVVLNKLVLVALVNVGLGVRAMVDVPEKRMFDPALKNVIGEL